MGKVTSSIPYSAFRACLRRSSGKTNQAASGSCIPDLSGNVAGSLVSKLENVIAKLDKDNAGAAINGLQAFTVKLRRWSFRGYLPPYRLTGRPTRCSRGLTSPPSSGRDCCDRLAAFHYRLSNVRYCTASLTCCVSTFAEPPRSAIVREILSTRW